MEKKAIENKVELVVEAAQSRGSFHGVKAEFYVQDAIVQLVVNNKKFKIAIDREAVAHSLLPVIRNFVFANAKTLGVVIEKAEGKATGRSKVKMVE